MAKLIWVTGRAAAGKSTVIAGLVQAFAARGVEVASFSDEKLVFELLRDDHHHEHHDHPYGDDRVRWLSSQIFDEALRRLSQQLHQFLAAADSTVESVALIELARGCDRPIDVSYARAVEVVDADLWPQSVVFRLDATWRSQVERNAARRGGPPDDVLSDLYRHDDPSAFVDAGIPVRTLAPAPAQVQVEAILQQVPTGKAPHVVAGVSGLTTSCVRA